MQFTLDSLLFKPAAVWCGVKSKLKTLTRLFRIANIHCRITSTSGQDFGFNFNSSEDGEEEEYE